MAQGHRAAEAIDAYLRGAQAGQGASGCRAGRSRPPIPTRTPRAQTASRCRRRDLAARLRDFREIDLGYSAGAGHRRSPALPGLRPVQRVHAVREGLRGRARSATTCSRRTRDLGVGSRHPHARLRGVPGLAARRVRPRALRQRALQRAVRADALAPPAPPAARSCGPPTAGTVKKIAFIQCVGSPRCRPRQRLLLVASAACPPPRKPWSPWSTRTGMNSSLHLLHGRARLRQGVRQLRQPRPRRARREVHPRHPLAHCRDARHQERRASATSTRTARSSSRNSTWSCSRVGLRPSAGVKDTGRSAWAWTSTSSASARPTGWPRWPTSQARHLRGRRVPGTQGHPRIGGPGLRAPPPAPWSSSPPPAAP